MSTEETFAADMTQPGDVGRALEILQNRLAVVEIAAGSSSLLLFGLMLALGHHRHKPFIAHSEIEMALLAMRAGFANGEYGEHVQQQVEVLLSLYRGEYDVSEQPVARHLHAVPSVPPESPPAATSDSA